MARLDIEKQKELEPQRMAKQEIEKKGYKVTEASRSIKDGRGLKNLLKQL